MDEIITLTVLVYRVGQEPTVEKVEDSVTAIQEIVGGYFEAWTLEPKANLIILCDEEAHWPKAKPVNRHVKSLDRLCRGDFIVSKVSLDGESLSMNDAEIEYAKVLIG